MPSRLSTTQRAQLSILLELDEDPKEIAAKVGCSYKHVLEIRRNIHAFGSPETPRLNKLGRKRAITLAMEEVRHL